MPTFYMITIGQVKKMINMFQYFILLFVHKEMLDVNVKIFFQDESKNSWGESRKVLK